MKRQVLAVVLGSLFALPAFANNEIDAGHAPTVSASAGKSRDQVRDELVAAQRAGNVVVNAELGWTAKQAATVTSGKTREEVRDEVVQARRAGNFIVNAELGTTANQL